MNEPCLSVETLAAYGDGKLTPAERREVERHLAACEDCFELFAGAAAYRLEEAAAGAVAAHPATKRPRFRWWHAAAAAAIVVAVGAVVRQQATTNKGGAEVLALANGLGNGKQLDIAAARAWSDDGALAFGAGLPTSKRAVRLGVHLLDARVALEARQEERFDAALDRVALLLPPQDGAIEIIEGLRRITGKVGQARRRADLDRLATAARSLDPAGFDLGVWAEAGRLAALSGRTDYLASTIAERLDESILRGTHEPAEARGLEAIRAALADREVSAAELPELERFFEQLILLH